MSGIYARFFNVLRAGLLHGHSLPSSTEKRPSSDNARQTASPEARHSICALFLAALATSMILTSQAAQHVASTPLSPSAQNTSLNGSGSVFLTASLVHSGGVNSFGATPSVAVADFNGDGKLDIAMADAGANAISILLGKGDGTFQAPIDTTGMNDPTYVASGDFNGDGKQDLAVVGFAGATPAVFVLMGNGDGTFTTKSTLTSISNPQSIILGDFNGDTKLDMVVTDLTTNSIYLFLGNGDGTFQAPSNISSLGIGGARYGAAADFNKDGKLDLVLSDVNSNHVVVLLGNGNGTFQAARSFAFPGTFGGFDVVVGDFNGDGIPDIAASSRDAGAVNILLGIGNGNFQAAVSYNAALPNFGPTNLVVGDFNKDGKLDILASQNQGSTVSVLFGKGDGTFSAPLFLASNNNPAQLAVGDFNGDGKLDWVAGSSSQMYLTVALGNGNNGFQDDVDYVLGVTPGIASGDFNKDGRPDLIAVDGGSGDVRVLLGNSDGTFQPAITTAVSGANFAIAVADLNGDGNPDVIVDDATGLAPRNVIVLLGKGDGTFEAPARYTTGGSGNGSIVVGDFNGDGKLDLAVVNESDNTISLLMGNGDGTFQAGKVVTGSLATDGFLGSMVGADFNHDGKLDLAIPDYCGLNCGQLNILMGKGDGTFQSPTQLATVSGATGITAADFNKDGKVDLAVAGQLGGVDVFLGNGDGTFNTPNTLSAVTCPTPLVTCPGGGFESHLLVVLAADFNLDGNLDLVVGGFQQDQGCPGCFFSSVNTGFQLFLGKGDGTFTGPQDYMAGAASTSMAIGDFNGDGAVDLATGDGGENMVTVLLNQSPPPISVSPKSLAFADQLVGTSSVTQPITVKNNGAAATTIGVAVSGDFTQSNTCPVSPATLAVGASCTINAAFKPTATGARNGAITVTHHLAGGPQTVTMTGAGIAPAVTLSTASINFGNQGVGSSSAPQMIGLTNSGTATLNISGISITGANLGDFSQANDCGGSVSAGANCNINVTFKPTASGVRVASVSITDSATGSPHAVSLTGTGTTPVVILSATSLNFSNQLVTTSSVAQNVMLTNNGNTTLNITSITITGANGGDFSETNTCGASVVAAANCSISVTFKPTATGNRAASVAIADDAGASPQMISLVGIGTDFSIDVVAGSSNTDTINAGQPATYNLQVTPVSGFNGAVTLSCAGAPSESTCATSSVSVTPNGVASSPFGVNVTTTAPSLVVPRGRPFQNPPLVWVRISLQCLLILTFMPLLARLARATVRARRVLAPTVFALLGILVLAGGCGGGGFGGGGVHNAGTPSGTYTLTVTGTSGGVNHIQKLTLKVN